MTEYVIENATLCPECNMRIFKEKDKDNLWVLFPSGWCLHELNCSANLRVKPKGDAG